MKAVIFSLFGKLIPKRRLLSPGKKTDDILQRGQKANKIGKYYYIRYATSALRVLAWLLLLAARELFKLFMDVKENTRSTAERATITKKPG